MNRYKLCSSCSEENQRKIEAYEKSRPDATVEDWEIFFAKNSAWQLKQQFNHCPQDFHVG